MSDPRTGPAVDADSPDPADPFDRAAVADLADRYQRMNRLADLFTQSAEEMRSRAELGARVLGDPEVAESAALATRTWQRVEEDVRAATTGRLGLLARSAQLDADALVVRATVHTYRWIDELQQFAYDTLGSIAGRAIGFLAPEVALGGAVVAAGLIETDAVDREDVAAYLGELAESHPELLAHITGGGGLLDGLQLRALLTVGLLSGENGALAARAGLRSLGADGFEPGFGPALRDIAAGLVDPAPAQAAADPADPTEPDDPAALSGRPGGLEGLMEALVGTAAPVAVQRAAPGRFIAYLPGPGGADGRRLRLVGGDRSGYTGQVVRAIRAAVAGDDDPRVLLVGGGQGGVAATEIAAARPAGFRVDQVVTAGSPAAQATQVPLTTHVLALEDRRDPVVLLGSLLNVGLSNRVTVVLDGGAAQGYVAGGRAADAAQVRELRDVLDRLRRDGFLAPA